MLPSEPRDRWAGSADELKAALLPHAAAGKSWLKYDESPKVHDAKHDPDKCLQAGDLLATLHDLHPKLSFTRETVKESIGMLVEDLKKGWKLPEKYESQYIETMTCRMMNLTRSVSQALAKKSPPEWTDKLPWMKSKGVKAAPLKKEKKEKQKKSSNLHGRPIHCRALG